MKTNKHNWTIVSCSCDPADEDSCSYVLFEYGAIGLEVENIDERNTRIKASFDPSTTSLDAIAKLRYRLKRANLPGPAETLAIKTIANQDWLVNWKKHFKPFIVGNAFIICPPWQMDIDANKLGTRRKIIIDPGMAFGTGLHATTKYCLHAIEQFAKGPKILDVGTGSGILAIACSILFPVSKIIAIDTDVNSISNAEHNLELNQITGQIELIQTSPDELSKTTKQDGQFDTLLSNLTAEDIIKLLPAYNQLLRVGGILILAGIIEERQQILESALAQYSFKKLNEEHEKGWVGLTLQKS